MHCISHCLAHCRTKDSEKFHPRTKSCFISGSKPQLDVLSHFSSDWDVLSADACLGNVNQARPYSHFCTLQHDE
ncbi:hypothetical protein Y1Q_0014818 [Alligator mississippiensis]|uniref:Uncharacterized protein n=1 Tax=Alligator mississippiensis TaxID=8496 RepID=A0A151M229_ALLMI|nr:hypothetical protein Y1Q_0014818 [Alligator mississippiensis]